MDAQHARDLWHFFRDPVKLLQDQAVLVDGWTPPNRELAAGLRYDAAQVAKQRPAHR